jgi:hypothetical protein
MENLRLYTYFRSGSAHRVCIALALKGIAGIVNLAARPLAVAYRGE